MINSLTDFDPLTAAGILARAALSVADRSNPDAASVVPDEHRIRERILLETRQQYGIADDDSEDSRERLCDALDAESDALLGSADEFQVLERLALKGDLPSDLYQIIVVKNIKDCYGKKYLEEEQNIKETVRSPDIEKHYGSPGDPEDHRLISLFARTFRDKYPARSFVMLVAGERKGLILTIFQAWRVYPEDVNLIGADSPLEMLRRFALVFGTDVTVGKETGRFMLQSGIRDGVPIPVHGFIAPIAGKSRRQVNVTHFSWKTADGSKDILTVGIDLDKYRDALKKRGW